MEIISRKEAKEHGLKHYFTGKPCKRGHIDRRFVSTFSCFSCMQSHGAEYRKENPELYREASKKYYRANTEECIRRAIEVQKKNPDRTRRFKKEEQRRNRDKYRERHKRWRHSDIQAYRDRQKVYRAENSERIRAYFRKYRKERMASDPDFKMRLTASWMVRRVLNKTGGDKLSPTEKLLGYTGEQLRRHIERNMLPDMNWDNYGSLWHIDHIISVTEMISLGVFCPSKINALGNLMPTYADENMSKGAGFALSAQPVL